MPMPFFGAILKLDFCETQRRARSWCESRHLENYVFYELSASLKNSIRT